MLSFLITQGRLAAKSSIEKKKKVSKKKLRRRKHYRKSRCIKLEWYSDSTTNGYTGTWNRACGGRKNTRRLDWYSRQVSFNDAADEIRRRDVAGKHATNFSVFFGRANVLKEAVVIKSTVSFASLVEKYFVLLSYCLGFILLPLQCGNGARHFFFL